MSQIEISPQQRDLLYLSITARLTGINDVYGEYQQGNVEAARLSQEFSDDLRVLHDDLGWGDHPFAKHSAERPARCLGANAESHPGKDAVGIPPT